MNIIIITNRIITKSIQLASGNEGVCVLPYVEFKQSQELTTVGKLYFSERLIRHKCRKCETRFYNNHEVGIKARFCADCSFDLYADNRSLEEFV